VPPSSLRPGGSLVLLFACYIIIPLDHPLVVQFRFLSFTLDGTVHKSGEGGTIEAYMMFTNIPSLYISFISFLLGTLVATSEFPSVLCKVAFWKLDWEFLFCVFIPCGSSTLP